jgi:hypothetical protein
LFRVFGAAKTMGNRYSTHDDWMKAVMHLNIKLSTVLCEVADTHRRTKFQDGSKVKKKKEDPAFLQLEDVGRLGTRRTTTG